MESAPPTTHDPANANLEHILSGIRPSLAHLPAGGDNWENAVYASVARNLSEVLRLSPVITEFAHAEKVVVVGAVYNLQTGKVEFLPEHAVVARSIPKPR
jgi:carbonic anhydrase